MLAGYTCFSLFSSILLDPTDEELIIGTWLSGVDENVKWVFMKNIFIIVLMSLFTIKLFACDCDLPKIALELYESDFVFKGKVTQKYYSTDLSKYTITVEAIKYYKGEENAPEVFTFTKKSIHNYEITSCDYIIDKFETLLLYVKFDGEKYNFGLMCSNSKRLNNNKKINKHELNILNNASKFDLSNYIIENERGFSVSKPLTNGDSIASLYKLQDVKKTQFGIVFIDIDEEGKLMKANLVPKKGRVEYKIVDTIFNLNYIVNRKYIKPSNDFEKYILKISRKLKYWTSYTHLKTGLAVRHRKHVKFYSDSEGNITIEY